MEFLEVPLRSIDFSHHFTELIQVICHSSDMFLESAPDLPQGVFSMEALQIELYFSLFVIFFVIGMAVYLFKMVSKKMKEDGSK
ncbi:MAG: hypothetical protein A2286_12455 [Gammaproteobacteria bacterium RIFOXYA12_FULL_61_12]|nr:MAG: hypothetical protein A2514_15665 [Gammaproteobacteria bacterium RIFOXYD12_FULL_61_37]OGT94302.1 MAG: hypothetical protein A2286_12455 [Gammaproteobacteria bacterium RIFOXYA12_FULL_61_12]